MATMNISLTEELKAFVDEQVASRHFTSTSEYLRELIRRQRDIEHVRGLIDEGLGSPIVGAIDETYFADLRDRARRPATG